MYQLVTNSYTITTNVVNGTNFTSSRFWIRTICPTRPAFLSAGDPEQQGEHLAAQRIIFARRNRGRSATFHLSPGQTVLRLWREQAAFSVQRQYHHDGDWSHIFAQSLKADSSEDR